MFPFAAGKGAASADSGPADAVALAARAPNLKEAAEPVVESLVRSLQKMAGVPGGVDGQIGSLALCDMRDLVAAHTPAWVVTSLQCGAVPCTLLVTVDPFLVHGLVDLLCGGGGREPAPSSPRDATAIDHQFVQMVVTLLAGAIEEHWAKAGFGRPSVVKIEAFTVDSLGPRIREAGCVDLRLSLFGVAGTLRLVLPPAALDRFGAEEVAGEAMSGSPDTVWADLFRRELGHAQVRLDAYLDARDIELGTLAALRPGQIIALAPDARSRTSLVSQGHVLFRGEIGQIADDRYSVRIEQIVADAVRALPTAAASAGSPLSESFRF